MDHYSFEGKHVLITGATGGIGRVLSRLLVQTGARLILSARSKGNLEFLAKEIPETGSISLIQADLTKPGEAALLADKAIECLGWVDVLFNLAGAGYFALMEEATEVSIKYLFELNTFSPMILIQKLVPHMIRRGGGRIINVVSCAGRVPIPTEGVYGGSKSAFAIMANTMRLELEPKKIDILNLYPGTAASDFERNARRENQRPGVCPVEGCGEPLEDIATGILKASTGPPGEVWLERGSKFLATMALVWPKYVDSRLKELRDRALGPASLMFPDRQRKWRLLQLESAIACNLKCVMCPWTGFRKGASNRGIMAPAVWEAVKVNLPEIQSVDFTGGGEPLLQPHLAEWIFEAHREGCETGFLTNGLLLGQEKAIQILDAGLNWICFSVDGADSVTYNSIRQGSSFDIVCRNIKSLTDLRGSSGLKTMINFVVMPMNAHQLESIVRLAADLGVDQVNFKQCDVIRGDHGKGFGLFAGNRNREIIELEKALASAERLARKAGLKTTAFSFVPEELPVCAQDPRNSIFVRYDGRVAPCINLAIGGPATFLGDEVDMPSVHYGCLPDQELSSLWETDLCSFYRKRFESRVQASEEGFESVDLSEPSLLKLKEARKASIDAMPEAPQGCQVCHYLYGI